MFNHESVDLMLDKPSERDVLSQTFDKVVVAYARSDAAGPWSGSTVVNAHATRRALHPPIEREERNASPRLPRPVPQVRLPGYAVQRLLCETSYACVFLAERRTGAQRVALKVLSRSSQRLTSVLARFRRESRLLLEFDHPHIVKAVDFGRWRRSHFLATEYVAGTDLKRHLRVHGPLPPLVAADLIRQAAEGLAYAHRCGVIHRDIKPGNLMVTPTGTLKIIDFGLARQLLGDDPSLTLRYDEHFLGTVDYMAPEQARDCHNIDGRADLYGLGCTLYFLLCGRAPFPEGTMAERLIQHQRADARPVQTLRPETPAELAEICHRLMAKRPEDRYQTASRLAEDLLRFLQQA